VLCLGLAIGEIVPLLSENIIKTIKMIRGSGPLTVVERDTVVCYAVLCQYRVECMA
jgi:hypothetical protein